ncbi:MAG: hypothetical protein ABF289_08155 [Clostridiales bacterium]
MSTTVNKLFDNFNINLQKPMKWKMNNSENKSGVYVIAITSDVNKVEMFKEPPFDNNKIKQWMNVSKDINIDGIKATPDMLKEELSKFWLSDETILYIGSANSIRKRINQYYNHILGKRSPHSGGDWIKTLKIFEDLNVFYGYTENYKEVEVSMLYYFSKNVSDISVSNMNKPMPFANKKLDVIKPHKIKKATVK